MQAQLVLIENFITNPPPIRSWPCEIEQGRLTIDPVHLAQAVEIIQGGGHQWTRLMIQGPDGTPLRTAEHFTKFLGGTP